MASKLMAPPPNATFIHRQTLAGQVRFTTTELAELEAKIASAADRALHWSSRSSSGWRRRSPRRAPPSRPQPTRSRRSTSRRRSRARGRARLCAAGGRCSARLRHQGRPSSGGRAGAGARRRPVRRQRLRPVAARRGAAGRIWLLTGPNMAGKSTFLRQNALIAVLAQMGSFVPARSAPHRRRSTGCSRASARPTTSRAAARPSWWRWSRPPPSSTRRASARSSSSTRSAAAPRPSTGSRSPGRRSSICTRAIAAARCSPPISTS